jgi:predicted permease
MSMDGWSRDARHALRGLLRRPGFAGVTILTLGLGIGANTAIFSVVNGVLLRPLPYADPDRLVMVNSAFPTLGFDEFWVSPPEYMELQERARSFEVLGAYRQGQLSIGGGDRPERVNAAVASATLFEALGVPPLLGRTYTREEDLPGAEPVIVLSHELWQRSFAADPGLVGRSIDANGVPRTVIGVMPPGFDVDESGIEAWQPLALDPANRENRGSHFLYVIGRLAPGVAHGSAVTELGQLVDGWQVQNPGMHTPDPEVHPMALTALREEVVGDVRQALLLLLGAVGFVLLIACANVANLLLARGEDRQKEVAVRVAMGAGRGRLLRQFLMEGVVLSALAGAFGVALAWASLEALRALGPGDIPRLREISLDGTVLMFTTGLALLTGVVFGLAPARHATRFGSGGALGEGSGRTTAGLRRTRLRSLLVVSEMALAMMLAVGAGLLMRSFQALTAVDPGFDARGVLTFQLFLPASAYPESFDVTAFPERLEQELAALPGVEGVALMTGLPPVRDLNANDTEFEGVERTEDGPAHNVDFYQVVSAGYLEAMRIPVLRGRGFLPSDGPDATPAVLVNETLARVFYPGQDPLGRRIRSCCGDIPWAEIVGVVADVKQAGIDQPAGTELYYHIPQAPALYTTPRTINVVVRTPGEPEAVAPSVREVVSRLDATLPLAGLRSMETVMAGARARPRFLTTVLGGFAALALLLAAVGTYGVMSYSVAQREKEVGIRMALGAEGSTVLALVLRQGLAVTGLGIGLGLAGAWALSGVLQSMLFEVPPRDLATFVLVPGLLAAAALLALWIPARRATRVNPVEVLREG